MSRLKKRSAIALTVAALMLLAACSSGTDKKTAPAGKPTLTVGVSGSFAENEIVAEMYAQVLEKAGYKITRQLKLKSREISEPALEKGQLDIVPEYVGSLLVFLDKNAKAGSNADENASAAGKLLDSKGLVLLKPSAANDTNAFAVSSKTASDKHLAKMSDLAPLASTLKLGGPPECPQRPFCAPGLKDKYGIVFGEFKPLDAGGPITVAALEGGEVDVGLLFSTSGAIKKKNFVLLKDDKGLQQADNLAPLLRKAAATEEVKTLLDGVSEKLTTENIADLNAKVEIDKQDPSEVAKAFLKKERLA